MSAQEVGERVQLAGVAGDDHPIDLFGVVVVAQLDEQRCDELHQRKLTLVELFWVSHFGEQALQIFLNLGLFAGSAPISAVSCTVATSLGASFCNSDICRVAVLKSR